MPSEHDELMTQHEQLDVFGELAAPTTDKQPQQGREGKIGEGKKHQPMLPQAIASGTETRNLGFGTLQERVAVPTNGDTGAREEVLVAPGAEARHVEGPRLI